MSLEIKIKKKGKKSIKMYFKKKNILNFLIIIFYKNIISKDRKKIQGLILN